jgi:hypothetical protein
VRKGGESLSQAFLRNPEGEVPKNPRQAHFDQPLRELQISETASAFAVYPIELHFQCWIAAANIVRDAPVEKRKDGEPLPRNLFLWEPSVGILTIKGSTGDCSVKSGHGI